KLVNGADPFYADRLGKLRESWSGMENSFNNAQEGRETAFTLSQADKESRFQAFLVSSGYVSKGDYAANVVLAERNEYVAVSAATTGTSPGLYRPNASATLPLTLTGTWAADSANLVLLGDDVLRQELSGTDGVTLIGGARRKVPSLSALASVNTPQPGAVVGVEHRTQPIWAEANPVIGGGGDFVWVDGDQTSQVSADPGQGLWVAPASDATGASGAWRRLYDGPLRAEWWGVADTGADITAQAQAFVSYCNAKKL
ncbi:MAG TPA: hypothetical protein DIC61_08940, partial [Pseudomonas sp.]|nr:hypothetical protein [Pseudomonas sp.]